MQLPKPEADQFFSLFKPLLVYTNQKFKITPAINTPEDIESHSFQETVKVRDKLYQNPQLFDEFVKENASSLSDEDVAIVQSWKGFLKSEFFVFRYLKKYTIFLTQKEPYKAYGVLSLYSPFEDIFGPTLPRLVDTVLLPFKNQIVSDGIFKGANIYFGSGIRSSLKDTYEEAKARFGIITSLEVPIAEAEDVDAAKLKAYLKNERSREEYGYEIQQLKEKSPALQLLYSQEMGKVFAKKHSKRFREIGLNNIWIALFEEMPIASGETKSEVERTINQILPSSQRQFVYIFHLKGKSVL
jgi:hypothetical protein